MSKTVSNIFYDAEFYQPEGEYRIIPISFGLVNETGSDFYYGIDACLPRTFIEKDPWLKKNVTAKLPPAYSAAWNDLAGIRRGVLDFFNRNRADIVQIWPRNGAYDNTLLCMLFGSMATLYSDSKKIGIKKMEFRDVNEIKKTFGKIDLPPLREEWQHISICDADYDRFSYHAYKERFGQSLIDLCAPRIS